MKVFHGATAIISRPLVWVGRKNLDFGEGFYTTDIKSQAINWAKRYADIRGEKPVVNIYDFDKEEVRKEFRYLTFERYDREWMEFIVANRTGKKAWQKYDVVEGGVANDRVIDTIEAYISGLISAEMAIAELSKHAPNNQICILRQEIIDNYLHFVKSEALSKGR